MVWYPIDIGTGIVILESKVPLTLCGLSIDQLRLICDTRCWHIPMSVDLGIRQSTDLSMDGKEERAGGKVILEYSVPPAIHGLSTDGWKEQVEKLN